MTHPDEIALLDAARTGDESAFEQLAARHHRELLAHCYRMLGSIQDAEDAVQESLLSAWRSVPSFEGRSSLRTWLYRITTNACLRMGSTRARRMLSPDHGPARLDPSDLGEPVAGPVWLEPWPGDELLASVPAPEPGPASLALRRESVELAFIAALQHLSSIQRAVLILREVLQFSAAETASMLGTTPASVNSALQRARAALGARAPRTSQQAERDTLGEKRSQELLRSMVTAWEQADMAALASVLADDVRFTMPPLPAWFDGRAAVTAFITRRVFQTPWRLVPITVNEQPGLACYQQASEQAPADDAPFRLGAINVLTLRAGRIAEITGFLDPALHAWFGLPSVLPPDAPLGLSLEDLQKFSVI